LEQAGHLAELAPPQSLDITAGTADVKTQLPRQGVSLLVLTWQ
jgi:hypothetical protein